MLQKKVQYWIYYFVYKDNTIITQNHNIIQLYAYMLLYTNNSFNFFFYGISSEAYRTELHSIFFKTNENPNNSFKMRQIRKT
jgi:hypothetical protein